MAVATRGMYGLSSAGIVLRGLFILKFLLSQYVGIEREISSLQLEVLSF